MSENTTAIPQTEVDSLLLRIKALMFTEGFSKETIDGTRIEIIHPNDWEISLYVPYRNTKPSFVRRTIDRILFKECGVSEENCEYYGKIKAESAYEWYFRHPNIPSGIAARIDAEIEAEENEDVDVDIPSPNGFQSKTDTVFLSLKDEFFEKIKNGEKTTEYRNLNQYYCDKLFSPGVKKRFVKFNRGYLSGPENQMVFEIADIVFVSDVWNEQPTSDEKGVLITSRSNIPIDFVPVMYGIKLGRRVS